MQIKLLAALPALAVLTACVGASDGSTVNPVQSPNFVGDFEMIAEPASINNTWGNQAGLNPNTKFVILYGVDEVYRGTDNEEIHNIHYVTTNIERAEAITSNGAFPVLEVARAGSFDRLDLTNTSNVVLRNGNITETDSSTNVNPYLYQNKYGENEHVQIYFNAKEHSDDYLYISASGPQFSGIPNGEITLSGRSVIHRVDNTNTTKNNPLGRFRGTSVEGGNFTLRINANEGTGTFRSESANSEVLSQNVIVDTNTGKFSSETTNITYIGRDYIGRLDGALHSGSVAATGVFASTDESPTVVGAFAGTSQ